VGQLAATFFPDYLIAGRETGSIIYLTKIALNDGHPIGLGLTPHAEVVRYFRC
jgi:hypothetical protein